MINKYSDEEIEEIIHRGNFTEKQVEKIFNYIYELI